MVFKSIIGAFVACLAMTSLNVSAAIISTDWKMAGDNLITQDTVSGLEWLDLTATANRSYNDVSSKFGAGQEFEGWQYASTAQVVEFFDAFGGDNAYYNTGWSTQLDGLFAAVSSYWGDLICIRDGCNQGEGGDTFYMEVVNTDYVPLGDIDGFDPSRPGQDVFNIDQCVYCIFLHEKTPIAGSALVRVSAVPLPPAAWLFGTGLLGLIGVARRKL